MAKSQNKEGKSESKDDLLRTTPDGAVELTEEQLDKVSGGKGKTADKNYKAMSDFLKG